MKKANTPLLSFCIHGDMLPGFLTRNRDALQALSFPYEIVSTASPEGANIAGLRVVEAGEGYNHIMQLLWRQALAPFVMPVDAADVIDAEGVQRALQALKRKSSRLAVASLPGGEDVREAFLNGLSLQGMVLRREAACRFLHVTELGLAHHWAALAQLAQAGGSKAVSYAGDPLSRRVRVPMSELSYHFSVRNAFFDSGKSERYCPEIRLYDTTTLERVIADAELCLLNHPALHIADRGERVKRMLEKRGHLYRIAMAQALEDGESSLALHFATRMCVCRHPQPHETSLPPLALDLSRDNGALPPSDVLRDMLYAELDRALAEQMRLMKDILGENTVLVVEKHERLERLSPLLPEDVQWAEPQALAARSPQAEEMLVFYTTEAMAERQQAMPSAHPGRAFSVEQMEGWLGSALHGALP